MPDVSVVMPMRNGERYVMAAVDSILQQDVDLELVVVDDGSTDRSRAMVMACADARVRVIDGPRRGIAAAVNAGVQWARGRYFVRCDADDVLPPGRLGRQMRFLEERPEFIAVCGQFSTLSRSGKVLAEMGCGDEARDVTEDLRGGRICTSLNSAMVRMEVVKELEFRCAFVTAEDIDYWLRLGEAGRVWFEPRPAYYYRLHEDSITHTQPSASREHFEAMALELQRQRRARGRDVLMERGELPPPPREGRQGAHRAVEHAQRVLIGASWRYLGEGRRLAAMRAGAWACLLRPVAWASWRNLAALAVKGCVSRE
jgi:glycosyltransferase involved in cell wall biosynthesis